jgi:hypothetical protein
MAAWVCLLAVILLWAPLGAVALEANGMGCCIAGFCAHGLHGHQRGEQAPPAEPAAAETSMGCEHHGATRNKPDAMKCSLSCCHETSAAMAAAIVFVLPATTSLSAPLGASSASPELTATEFMQSIEPLSPPPRITLPAA